MTTHLVTLVSLCRRKKSSFAGQQQAQTQSETTSAPSLSSPHRSVSSPPSPATKKNVKKPRANSIQVHQVQTTTSTQGNESRSHLAFLNRKLFSNKSKVSGESKAATESQIELDIKRDHSRPSNSGSSSSSKHHLNHPATGFGNNSNNNSSGGSNNTNASSITIRIISIKGGFIDVHLPITKTGKELKLEAIGRFAVDTNALPLYAPNLEHIVNKYKLVTIDKSDVIDEDLSLQKLQLKHKGN